MTAIPEIDRPSDGEALSKDRFFAELAELGRRMTAAHGRDFSMGALILAARFIAEGRSFDRPQP